MRTNMRLHCVWMRYWPYNVRFAELIKGALLCTFRSTARASLASPYGRGGRAQRVPEGETNPGKHLASPFDVPREHPLPLPMGEVAERSECPKGRRARENILPLPLVYRAIIPCLSLWERWPSAARPERANNAHTQKTTPYDIIIQKRLQLPLSHLAVTALPRGEPRGCTSLHSMSA